MMLESGELEKWFKLEMGKVTAGIVKEQRSVLELLTEKEPFAYTKSGEKYPFDKKVLVEFASLLSEKEKRVLKLPVFFYLDMQVEDSCYLVDVTAVEILKKIGLINKLYSFREGKLWLGKPLAMEIINKYYTLFQIVVL